MCIRTVQRTRTLHDTLIREGGVTRSPDLDINSCKWQKQLEHQDIIHWIQAQM